MKWNEFNFYSGKEEEEEVGIFEIVPDKLIKKARARKTPWSISDIERYSKEVTVENFKILVSTPFKDFEKVVKFVEVDDLLYEVIEVNQLGDRYFLAIVKEAF